MTKCTALLVGLICVAPTLALADLRLVFRDGAPKDSFVITHSGSCASMALELTLDMEPSAGQLIFDTTGSGAGVQVYQPLEFTSGAEFVKTASTVTDGQKTLTLDIGELPAQGSIAFTIDVDDTIGQREITVSGAEISGSTVTVRADGESYAGVFDMQGEAVVSLPACTS